MTQNAAFIFINGVLLLLEAHRQVFSQERVTDLLRALGLMEEDWGAWYRLFQKPGRFLWRSERGK